jgi:Ni/Co efflux regulator RcnB
MTLAAMAAVAGPIAAGATSAAADDRGRYDRREDRGDRREDRRDRREDYRDARRDDGRWDRREDRWDRREDRWDRREDRWDRREDRWDSRSRWDRGRHNGYYWNNRWYYGPPPATYYGHPGYRPGYAAWRRGAYLPPSYRGRGYVVHDYGRYGLRAPPRGYYWYRDGDNYLLAALATGLILDVIINH